MTYKVYLPKNLDIRRLYNDMLVNVNSNKNDKDKQAERLMYLCHAVSQSLNRIEDKEGFAPLSASILQSIIREYRTYLNSLIDNGILETDGSYLNGKKCKGYRFTQAYRSKPLKAYSLHDERLIKAIHKDCSDKKIIKQYRHLYDNFTKINIEEDLADFLFCFVRRKKDKKLLLSADKETIRRNLEAFSNKRIRTFKKGKTGRLYTSMSNLKKEFRSCLTVDNKSLIGIDIKNSIPFLFATVILDKEQFSRYNISDRLGKLNNYSSSLFLFSAEKEKTKLHSNLMLVKVHEGKVDVSEFIELCTTGIIYDEFAKRLSRQLSKTYTRSAAKKAMLTVLHSPRTPSTDVRKVFRRWFPNITQIIDEINTGFTVARRKKGKKVKRKPGEQICTFAHLMQQLEADLVLDTICKVLEEDYPHIPIFTIHDCILTTPEYVDIVKAVMRNETLYFTDKEPLLEIEEEWIKDESIKREWDKRFSKSGMIPI